MGGGGRWVEAAIHRGLSLGLYRLRVDRRAKSFSVGAVVIAILLFGLAGCNRPTSATAATSTTSPTVRPPASSITQATLAITQSKSLSVSLYGLMTFSVSGSSSSYPTQLFVPAVPLTWSGTSFTGRLEEAGPGEDITDEVSGAVSSDGSMAESVRYSRKVIRSEAGNGTSYTVALHNVPLGPVSQAIGGFQKSGAEVQNYVASIEYADGPLSGGDVVPSTKYVSTDWANSTAGQAPVLKGIFAR